MHQSATKVLRPRERNYFNWRMWYTTNAGHRTDFMSARDDVEAGHNGQGRF